MRQLEKLTDSCQSGTVVGNLVPMTTQIGSDQAATQGGGGVDVGGDFKKRSV